MRWVVGLIGSGLLACGSKTELDATRALEGNPPLRPWAADAAVPGAYSSASPAAMPVVPAFPSAAPSVATGATAAPMPVSSLPPSNASAFPTSSSDSEGAPIASEALAPPDLATSAPEVGTPPGVDTPDADTTATAPTLTAPTTGTPTTAPPIAQPPITEPTVDVPSASAPSASAPSVPTSEPVASDAEPPIDAPPAPEPIPSPRPDEPGIWGGGLPAPAEASSVPFTGCASIEWLGGDLFVRAVSADGSTLVGNAGPISSFGEPTGPAFRWRRGEAIEWLGAALETGARLGASDVSADGAWLAATLFTPNTESVDADETPVRVGPDGEIEVLATDGEAVAISADGNVVVGAAIAGPDQTAPDASAERTAFRWNTATGFEALPLYPDGDELRTWRPTDMSADGSIVLGQGGVLFSSFCVNYVDASEFGGACMEGSPAISADGSFAVNTGEAGRYASHVSALLLATGESLELDFPTPSSPLAPSSLATCVNADGSIVAGIGETPDDASEQSRTRPYVWQRDVGTKSFKQILEDSCVDVSAIPESEWQVTTLSGDSHLLVLCTILNAEGHCYIAAWP